MLYRYCTCRYYVQTVQILHALLQTSYTNITLQVYAIYRQCAHRLWRWLTANETSHSHCTHNKWLIEMLLVRRRVRVTSQVCVVNANTAKSSIATTRVWAITTPSTISQDFEFSNRDCVATEIDAASTATTSRPRVIKTDRFGPPWASPSAIFSAWTRCASETERMLSVSFSHLG